MPGAERLVVVDDLTTESPGPVTAITSTVSVGEVTTPFDADAMF